VNIYKIVREGISILFIIIGVLAFRSTFYEPFKIPSGSMIPTLLIGDFILVNKFAYGFKVPFSDWFTDPTYITGPGAPERGDVVVFKYPKNVSLNYIKRVVGLPGDTVEVKDKVVFINDKKIATTEIDGKEIMEDMDEKFKVYNFKFFTTETGKAKHVSQHNMDSIYASDFYKVTVPKGHYFVMGDNRDFSADSRIWGFVPFKYIKGKAVMVWFSMNFSWPWSNESEAFSFRPWRIGNSIL
jgi:signal peptidase I